MTQFLAKVSIALKPNVNDPEGNTMGLWRGRDPKAPLLAVAAHLDTVFPAGTDAKVKRSGTRLAAPGVGDDTRGLAFLLALIRAMRTAGVETPGDILFIGNVGEEGPGDLRGVRYLFAKGKYKDRIAKFITVDGRSNDSITNGALGMIHASRFGTGYLNTLRLRIFGDRGALEVQHGVDGSSLRACVNDDIEGPVWQDVVAEPVKTNYQRFVEAVTEGRSLDPTFRHATYLQKILDLAMATDRARQEQSAL